MAEFTLTVTASFPEPCLMQTNAYIRDSLHIAIAAWAEVQEVKIVITDDYTEETIAELCEAIREVMSPLGNRSYAKAAECLRKYDDAEEEQ